MKKLVSWYKKKDKELESRFLALEKETGQLNVLLWLVAAGFLVLVVLFAIIINIIQIIKKNKGNPDFSLGAFAKSIPDFLKSKLFLGIVIMVAASFILETVGFIVTALFVLFLM